MAISGVTIPDKPLGGNPMGSFIEGIKTGHDYARAKSLIDYRNAEIQRQQAQMDAARQLHQAQIQRLAWQQFSDAINEHNPKMRALKVKFFSDSMAQVGKPVSDDLQALMKDDTWRQDMAKSMGDVASAKDPKVQAQAMAGVLAMAGQKGPEILKTQAAIAALGQKQENFQSSLDLKQQQLQEKQSEFGSNQLKDASKTLLSNKTYSAADTASQEADKLQRLLDLSIDPVNGRAAAAQIPAAVARMITNSSRVPQVEMANSRGSQALLDKLAQGAQTASTGTMTLQNYKQFSAMTNELKTNFEQTKLNKATAFTKSFVARNGGEFNDIFYKITGDEFPFKNAPTQDQKGASQAAPQEKGADKAPDLGLPAEHVDHIKSTIQSMKSQGIKDDDIKSALQKGVPNLKDQALQYLLSPSLNEPPAEANPVPPESSPETPPAPDMGEEQ